MPQSTYIIIFILCCINYIVYNNNNDKYIRYHMFVAMYLAKQVNIIYDL